MKRDCILKFKVSDSNKKAPTTTPLLKSFPDGVKLYITFKYGERESHVITSDEVTISAPARPLTIVMTFSNSYFKKGQGWYFYSPYNASKKYLMESPIILKEKKGVKVELTELTFVHSGFEGPKIKRGFNRSKLHERTFDDPSEVSKFSEFLLKHNIETGANYQIKNVVTQNKVWSAGNGSLYTHSWYAVFYYNKKRRAVDPKK